MKNKRLYVERLGPFSKNYEVIKVVDNVKPGVGDMLTEAELQGYCAALNWTITITLGKNR